MKFKDIWGESPVFQQLRNPEAYGGKCGECRFEGICGGCRARAYAATGSFLAEEPFCSYRPDLDVIRVTRASRPETPAPRSINEVQS